MHILYSFVSYMLQAERPHAKGSRIDVYAPIGHTANINGVNDL